MGAPLELGEEYSTPCGSLPLSFIQMLASCIAGYHDIAGVLHYRVNGLQTSGPCSWLDLFADCDTSHIDPERQLVENTFAIDDCNRLAWKVYSNSDNDWEDYGDCGEMPQTLIQMLARCIVTLGDYNMINAIIDTGTCEEVTALLDCSTNNIEAERLLVNNVFATDDCGNLLIKFYANSSSMTDYTTACINEAQSFYQMLARCIVTFEGHNYINTASVTGFCDDLHDFWTCSNNHIDPERAIVENLFATDDCGNLALKIYNNGGTRS